MLKSIEDCNGFRLTNRMNGVRCGGHESRRLALQNPNPRFRGCYQKSTVQRKKFSPPPLDRSRPPLVPPPPFAFSLIYPLLRRTLCTIPPLRCKYTAMGRWLETYQSPEEVLMTKYESRLLSHFAYDVSDSAILGLRRLRRRCLPTIKQRILNSTTISTASSRNS